jgi:hypothetical protein
MIRYALRCARGHAFESWFKSSAAYDSQRKRGLVACPTCDSTKVEKAIMAPRIAAKGKSKAEPVPAPAEEAPTPLMMAPQEREIATKLKELRDHVLKTADNVGRKFPDEARKMHYGDIEHRAIYGEATTEEARALIDEGVEVAPLPVFPDDRN